MLKLEELSSVIWSNPIFLNEDIEAQRREMTNQDDKGSEYNQM